MQLSRETAMASQQTPPPMIYSSFLPDFGPDSDPFAPLENKSTLFHGKESESSHL